MTPLPPPGSRLPFPSIGTKTRTNVNYVPGVTTWYCVSAMLASCTVDRDMLGC